VFVYKLIVAGSIEEKILALQEKKAALAELSKSGSRAKLSCRSGASLGAGAPPRRSDRTHESPLAPPPQ
jgi:hypothetical protein